MYYWHLNGMARPQTDYHAVVCHIAYLWFSCVVFGKTRVKKGDRKTWQTWLTDIQIFFKTIFFTFLHLFFSVTFPHFIHQGNGYDGVQKNIHQGRGKYKSIGFFLVHSVVLFTIIISSRMCLCVYVITTIILRKAIASW